MFYWREEIMVKISGGLSVVGASSEFVQLSVQFMTH